MTYRLTGDAKIMWDITKNPAYIFPRSSRTMVLAELFSHIESIDLNPRADSLHTTAPRKNWNSIGDRSQRI
jgi:hypothetical protein